MRVVLVLFDGAAVIDRTQPEEIQMTTTQQEVARTILNQLAGSQRHLTAAVDAKDFLALENGVAFRIMANAGKVRQVRITL